MKGYERVSSKIHQVAAKGADPSVSGVLACQHSSTAGSGCGNRRVSDGMQSNNTL